ncbi:BON domain-containing protein [Nocardia jiangxiensis]|uniref:BON domain-containing protein n=1 Tax=Nocardia jiangxiensis TaxID=282685 RepID=UPI000319A6B9|nr:BON domain-containing protein [Nocardia jiangxiensis]
MHTGIDRLLHSATRVAKTLLSAKIPFAVARGCAARLEHTGLLRTARELREQVDWSRVAERAGMSPCARAFLGLLDDLHIGHGGDVTTDDLSPQYSAANLRRALAEDPRTAELGVRVSVRDNAVVLCGEVASSRRCRQLEDIVREHAPKLLVHNDIRVTTPDVPASHEQLD